MTQDSARELSDRYTVTAAAYRQWWAPILLTAAHRLLAAMPLAGAARIVDVGCGTGACYEPVRRIAPTASVVGLDRSHGMLAEAPAHLPRAVADARRLPLATGGADAALMMFMLFHLEQPLDGLREARRVLCAGGCVGASTWATDMQCDAGRTWTQCLDEYGAAEPPGTAHHDLLDSPRKVGVMLEQAGFANVRSWTGELAASYTLANFLNLKTTIGSDARRLETLNPRARADCIAEARRRLRDASGTALHAVGEVVYAVAT